MLPTPQKETDRPAVDRGFNDLDSLINELNVPRDVIKNTAPTSAPSGPASPGISTDTPADQFGGPSPELVEGEAMPDEVAALSGKTIATTIDTALGTGCSLYAKNTTPEKYQATEKQLSNLETAWAAVAKKYNYRVEDSPWFNVIILTIAIYLPHVQEAKTDRRFALIEERAREEREAREALAKRVEKLEENDQKAAA